MRELEVVLEVELSPEALLRLLYDDEGVFYRRYHAVVTGDAGARVSRWGAVPRDAPPVPGLPPPAPGDLTRSVSFVKRMELPTAITRLLGDVSALEVEEVQRLRLQGGRAGGAEIFSAPIVKMKGLEKFTTALVTRVEARPGGRSALRTRFKVEASVYGVQRLVEAAMEREATASVTSMHEFASGFVSAFRRAGGPAPRLRLLAAGGGSTASGSAAAPPSRRRVAAAAAARAAAQAALSDTEEEEESAPAWHRGGRSSGGGSVSYGSSDDASDDDFHDALQGAPSSRSSSPAFGRSATAGSRRSADGGRRGGRRHSPAAAAEPPAHARHAPPLGCGPIELSEWFAAAVLGDLSALQSASGGARGALVALLADVEQLRTDTVAARDAAREAAAAAAAAAKEARAARRDATRRAAFGAVLVGAVLVVAARKREGLLPAARAAAAAFAATLAAAAPSAGGLALAATAHAAASTVVATAAASE